MSVLGTVAPIFVIIALGAVLYRTRFLTDEAHAGIDRLTYWVGIPCLLFYETATTPIDLQPALRVTSVVILTVLACIAAGLLASKVMKLDGPTARAVTQASYRGNLAYVGLPVVLYGLHDTAMALATTSLALLVPIYNITAVLVLSSKSGGAWKRIVTNPLLLGCVAGLLWRALGWPMPDVAARVLSPVGRMALPLGLIGLGASIAAVGVRGRLGPAFVATSIKLVGAPAVAWGVATAMALTSDALGVALVFAACPTAISSYVMARQLGADTGVTSGTVVMSTLLSMLSLSVVLAVAR